MTEVDGTARGWSRSDFQAQGMCGEVSPDGLRVCVLHPDLDHTHEWDPETLESRLARIEAILRDHGLHEPECPVRRTNEAQRHTGVYLTAQPCDCWLMQPAGS